jgi:nitrile hydratase subunit beta
MTAFAVGDRVAVRDAWQPGHVRTPHYIKGHVGTVAQVLGAFPNPEELAYRRAGLPKSTLYRVRFKQPDLWPGYAGPADDTLDIELYHHWLAPER